MMKKVILTMLAVFTIGVNGYALSPGRAREEARFLTDKMRYELDLTADQTDDVYEINYDYFRALGPVDEFYDSYLDRRYEDLSYVLYDWQWDYFLDRDYFVHPAYIYHGGWAFAIYNYYRHASFFFGLPGVYFHYEGGHFRHPNYYADRFDMHRRAVSRMPKGVDRRPERLNGPSRRNDAGRGPAPSGRSRENVGYSMGSRENVSRSSNRENRSTYQGNSGDRNKLRSSGRESRSRSTSQGSSTTRSEMRSTSSRSSSSASSRSSSSSGRSSSSHSSGNHGPGRR